MTYILPYKPDNSYKHSYISKKPSLSFNGLKADSFQGSGSEKPNFSTAKEAKKYSKKQFGINAKFDDKNMKLANLVIDAFKDVQQKGCQFDKGMKLICNDNQLFKVFPKKFAKFNEPDNLFIHKTKPKITINPNLIEKWKNAGKGDNLKTHPPKYIKYYSTKNPKHAIYHEIGHYLHYKNSPDKYNLPNKYKLNDLSKAISETFPNEDKSKIMGKIVDETGLEAFENTSEFVAEFFAGMMAGKKYSPQLNKLYKSLEGPVVL